MRMDEVHSHDQMAGRLAQAGVESSEIPARLALMDEAVQGFERAVGRLPAWGWLVPGRIEIFGKHTDYAGGRSLVGAVPRGFALVAAPRRDAVVTARDIRWNAAMEVDAADEARVFHGWANYVAVVARRLARNFPNAPLGADVAFASDLPRAAGVSSSSALVVGVALALIRRAGLDGRPEWRQSIQDQLDLAGYLGAVENGLTFRALAGASGVGTHGGSEDHNAILNGRPDHVSAFSYVPTRLVGEAAMPADWRFVLMTSGVEAAKAGAARGRYNYASLATRALVEVWHRATGDTRTQTLAEVLGSAPGADADLRSGLGQHRHPDFPADALARRLAHFMAEDARVPLALEAFARRDRVRLGELSAASQADAEGLLGNQIPETTALAALARDAGAFASSSFGAGFGGSVWALADAGEAASVADRWRAAYLARVPGLGNVNALIVRPSAPALGFDFRGWKIES
jgi:galactokinase